MLTSIFSVSTAQQLRVWYSILYRESRYSWQIAHCEFVIDKFEYWIHIQSWREVFVKLKLRFGSLTALKVSEQMSDTEEVDRFDCKAQVPISRWNSCSTIQTTFSTEIPDWRIEIQFWSEICVTTTWDFMLSRQLNCHSSHVNFGLIPFACCHKKRISIRINASVKVVILIKFAAFFPRQQQCNRVSFSTALRAETWKFIEDEPSQGKKRLKRRRNERSANYSKFREYLYNFRQAKSSIERVF